MIGIKNLKFKISLEQPKQEQTVLAFPSVLDFPIQLQLCNIGNQNKLHTLWNTLSLCLQLREK